MAVSVNGGAYSTAVAYATTLGASLSSGDGLYTIVVKLTDVACNTGTYSQTVRLDTTGPAITAASMTAPAASGGYDGTFDPTYTVSASDVSGIGSITAKVDGTTALSGSTVDLDTLTAGTHTLVVTVADGLGNTTTTTLTFVILPTVNGLINAVKEGQTAGSITSTEATSLLSILNSTTTTQATKVNNFLTAVNNAGKSISAAENAILTNWGQNLAARITAGTAVA
jgi:hypothetical protein